MKRQWCIGQLDSRYLARLEALLRLYAKPYDPQQPVICFDERPCFLIGDKLEPLAMSSGQVGKEHYAYEKNGSCALLVAIEPLTGRRLAQVHAQRRKVEFAHFMRQLAYLYPEADVIHVVLDNLNTHDRSAFYEQFVAAEALALAERFQFHYTPTSASWLNMVEIELSALARLCLNRRIPTRQQLATEVLALVAERHDKRTRIDWQFSVQDARHVFNKHYQRLNPLNQKYHKT